MHVRIRTALTRLGYDLAADLEARGLGPIEVFTGPTTAFELRHRPGVGGTEITRLLEAIKPLQPDTIRPEPSLEGIDAELSLGDEAPLNAWEVRVDADSPELAALVRELAEELGFRDLGTNVGVQEGDALLFGGAPPFARQVLRWRLKKLGLKVKEQRQSSWADTDDDVWLTLRDPAQAGKPLAERFDVRVRSDDPAWGAKLVEWLKQAGFRVRPPETLNEAEALEKPFQLAPGPFGADRAPAELARLTVLVQDLIADARTDTTKYPLRVPPGGEGDCAEILLPVRACKGGRKRPYSGPYPERFAVRVHTDDPDGAEPLRKALAEAGFPRVEVVEGDADDLNRGYAVHWGAAAKEPEIAARLRQAVEEAMREQGASPPFELFTAEQFSTDDPDVWVYFPLLGLDDGSLLDRLSDPSRFKLTLHSPDPEGWSDLLATWEKWGFRGCATESSEVRRPQIDFGGAPGVLLERLRESVRDAGGLDVATSKRWDDADTDVWIYLPERSPATRKPGGSSSWETDAFDVRSWFAHQLEPAKDRHPSFVEVTADRVRVGTVWLPRRKPADEPFVPDPAAFAHFCLDGRTAETLHHVALSVALREPCLLEGETSTSKTSSVLYLAALLGQPVVRINLNGQTDTGELVGRYVPNSEPGARDPERGTEDQASPVPRPGSRAPNWRWQDGPIVAALKRGWWVLLDEVNLAEPQILERLNSVLEREPTLVLTEHDHSAYGFGGRPIHPDFRVFATMNPAEYAGRSVLSPAYRDRWRAHRFIPRPGEAEYLAMLQYLVHGRQPEVAVLDRTYPGTRQPAPLAGLAEFPEVDALLPALASFHAALEHAAGQNENDPARIGGRRKERYVFTRRGLLSLVEYLASPFGGAAGLSTRSLREALLRYYLSRVSSAQDQRLIAQLLDAAGLAPGSEPAKPAATNAPPAPAKKKPRRPARRKAGPEDEIPF